MNTAWQDTLSHLGYTLDDEAKATPQVPYDGTGTAVAPLTQHRIIEIIGPETEKFLQGQLSCDIADVDKLGSRLGAHCNIKGHMISLFRVMKRSLDTFWLRTRSDNLDKALPTLKKYILFSKAEADLNDELVGIGLFGTGAAEIASKLVSKPPECVDEVSCEGERLLVRVPGVDRFECWLPAAEAATILNELGDSVQLAGTDDWLLQEIRAAVPDVCASTSEAFIPQMTNLQAFEGVSFNKGCYTGQEVVTRLQHRGILKKPMYRVAVSASECPEPGQALHTTEKENIGQIVIAAPTGDSGYEMLAVITKEQAENAELHLATQDGPVVKLLELPYTLDPRMFESKR
ncbi:YgfZ/GcvT domain-containing protein [Marinobacterium litorale]|jgi:folate-binding protein YgfZ|uniref:CAF17-like 4Fe-4S cluster assembly/insertion protein YgfZ n=1 Tax=Marinobacterium litorale TaxID=404770 RepID=UPI00040D747A|nr:folate-binding protein YgfZ [Marinobacterium litorale]